MPKSQAKKIIAILGSAGGGAHYKEALVAYFGTEYRIALIENKKKFTPAQHILDLYDDVILIDFTSERTIRQTLAPYAEALAAVTCFSEPMMPTYRKLIPHLPPHIKVPTVDSIKFATNKIEMRTHFHAYDSSITPNFFVVSSASPKVIEKITKTLEFPVVVKPSGLAASLLVTVAYHKEELEKVLNTVFKKIGGLYETSGRTDKPQVLVEEFMEGTMYTIDAYVDEKGKIYFCPPVYVKTGKEIGFDDFFGYLQMTPTRLNKGSIKKAQQACTSAIRALGMRNTSAHIELFKTEDGWKVIELGPRIGGFRHNLAKFSFGINHIANDMLNKLGKKPVIKDEVIGYSAAMRIHARKEGKILKIGGLKKVQQLASFKKLTQLRQVGQRAEFAKHGGKSVLAVLFSNSTRAGLLGDVRRLEDAIKIEVGK